MKRTLILTAFIATSAVAVEKAVLLATDMPPKVVTIEPYNGAGNLPAVRNLLLNAATEKEPEPGMIRIPVPVDGVLYEIIVTKPGEPKLIRATKSDGE